MPILFLIACGVVVWATYATIAGRVPTWSRVLYLLALTASVIAAFIMTFRFTYMANDNTRFHGWPVPTVIFQRSGPNEPWLDYVGPTVILAYPTNLVLFAFIPSALVLVAFFFHKRSQVQSQGSTPVSNGAEPTQRIGTD